VILNCLVLYLKASQFDILQIRNTRLINSLNLSNDNLVFHGTALSSCIHIARRVRLRSTAHQDFSGEESPGFYVTRDWDYAMTSAVHRGQIIQDFRAICIFALDEENLHGEITHLEGVLWESTVLWFAAGSFNVDDVDGDYTHILEGRASSNLVEVQDAEGRVLPQQSNFNQLCFKCRQCLGSLLLKAVVIFTD
jgi:hypothetical protein